MRSRRSRRKKRKRKDEFSVGEIAIANDLTPLIKASETGIPPNALHTAGFTLCGFRSSRAVYLKLEEVVGWYRREAESAESKGYSHQYVSNLYHNLTYFEKAFERLNEKNLAIHRPKTGSDTITISMV